MNIQEKKRLDEIQKETCDSDWIESDKVKWLIELVKRQEEKLAKAVEALEWYEEAFTDKVGLLAKQALEAIVEAVKK